LRLSKQTFNIDALPALINSVHAYVNSQALHIIFAQL